MCTLLYRLQAAVAQGILKDNYKTELCAHKTCTRGVDCWFYHSEEDRLPLCGYKGQLCRAWQVRRVDRLHREMSAGHFRNVSMCADAGCLNAATQETGTCPAGIECNYAHGGSDLIMDLGHAFQERQVVAVEASSSPPSPTSTEGSRSTAFHDVGTAGR